MGQCGLGSGWVGGHLLTAQLALVLSPGAVPVEVTGLPELEGRPIPASEGTLQGHLGAQGCSWKAHRDTGQSGQPHGEAAERASLCPAVHTLMSDRDTCISVWLHQAQHGRLRGSQSPNTAPQPPGGRSHFLVMMSSRIERWLTLPNTLGSSNPRLRYARWRAHRWSHLYTDSSTLKDSLGHIWSNVSPPCS